MRILNACGMLNREREIFFPRENCPYSTRLVLCTLTRTHCVVAPPTNNSARGYVHGLDMELEVVTGSYDSLVQGFSIDALEPESKVYSCDTLNHIYENSVTKITIIEIMILGRGYN